MFVAGETCILKFFTERSCNEMILAVKDEMKTSQ